jgi:hypothetical protein
MIDTITNTKKIQKKPQSIISPHFAKLPIQMLVSKQVEPWKNEC